MLRWILLLILLACGSAGNDRLPIRGEAIRADDRKNAEDNTGTSSFTLPAPPRRVADAGARPVVPGPAYPAGFQRDSAFFLQTQVGRWTAGDARSLLGQPLRRRAAADDPGNDPKGGHIFAFPDPTRRYRELELDFDPAAGTLRAVFAYPSDLAWQDCRKTWGMNFTSTGANKGRTFYSYTARRLDVLVDPGGHVISLGLY